MKSVINNTMKLVSALVLSVVFSANVMAEHHGKKMDIVDTAASNSDFTTLVAAVKAAGLVDALKADGPLTVFAPTNEAFAKLPAGTVESLLLPENKAKLVQILTYHVVAGQVMAADVVKIDSAKTLEGSSITVTMSGGGVKVDNANVTATDIKTSNGVIHVIDTVIMPKG
ncbi:MAG: putative surface protein with fasciclin (FAS1) repeats [Glaciecola sp.]|jgi:uncharacterized surface protein with fasciclin (FAS1) repeats